MRIYTVHVPTGAAADGFDDRESAAILIKEGFSWPAFFLAPLWALWHRLWLFLVVILVAGWALDAAARALAMSPAAESALGLGFLVWLGAEANDWRRRGLARRGYRMAGLAAGRDLVSAERRLFERGAGAGG
ncbi:MAG: DUF2628 domain-containing protein [Alphaproteobacteria bacterium]